MNQVYQELLYQWFSNGCHLSH